MHALALNALMIEKIHEGQVKVGRATSDVNDPTLKFWFQHFIRAHGAYLYKQKYDLVYFIMLKFKHL